MLEFLRYSATHSHTRFACKFDSNLRAVVHVRQGGIILWWATTPTLDEGFVVLAPLQREQQQTMTMAMSGRGNQRRLDYNYYYPSPGGCLANSAAAPPKTKLALMMTIMRNPTETRHFSIVPINSRRTLSLALGDSPSLFSSAGVSQWRILLHDARVA